MNKTVTYLCYMLVLLLTPFSANAQQKEEMNILFIGNSFTYRHQLSGLVKEIIEEGKPHLNVNVSEIIYGGQSLFQHTEYYYSQSFIEQASIESDTIQGRIDKMKGLLDLTEPPPEYVHFWQNIRNRSTFPDFPKDLVQIAINRHVNLLNNNSRTKWDYVVLQSWEDEVNDMNDGYAKYARYLSDIATAQGARVILYITAPDIQNAEPVSMPVNQENVDQEISFVLDLARDIQPYAVVHVPLAINRIQEAGTELAFRYVNDFHPNQRTAYLTANMFYAAFFNESTEGFAFNTVTENKIHYTEDEPDVPLDPDGGSPTVIFEGAEKLYLQKSAYDAVMEFLKMWKGNDPIPVTGFSIVNPPGNTLDLGIDYQINVSIQPLYATHQEVIWEVTSGNAVTVDNHGLVTTLNEGSATVKVSLVNGEFSDSCEIHVEKKIISVYGLTVGNCPNTILETGDTLRLFANVAPPDADDTSVTWQSSNPEVASVNENGLVEALTQGTTKITATTNDGGYAKSCSIGIMWSATGFGNYMINNEVKIFPNPAGCELNINFQPADEEKEIRIFNLQGQLLYSATTTEYNNKLDIGHLKKETIAIVNIRSNRSVFNHPLIIE